MLHGPQIADHRRPELAIRSTCRMADDTGVDGPTRRTYSRRSRLAIQAFGLDLFFAYHALSTRGTVMHHHRKLLILGINHLLAIKAITLDEEEAPSGHVFASIAGRPSVILWSSIGFGELRVSVWWDYDHAKHPQANSSGASREAFTTSAPLAKRSKYPVFVGATASGWLERKDGKWLQGKGPENIFDAYVRRDARNVLAVVQDPTPSGYGAEGRFYI